MRRYVIFAFFAAVCSAQAADFVVNLDIQVWVSTPKVVNVFSFSDKAGLQFDNHQVQNNAVANAVSTYGKRANGINHVMFDSGEANPGPITESRADANSADGEEFDLLNMTNADIPVTLSYEYSWVINLNTNVGEAAYGGFALLLAGTSIDAQTFQIGSLDSSDASGGGSGSVIVTAVRNNLSTPFMNAVTTGWATAPPEAAATPEPSSLLCLAVPMGVLLRRRKLARAR